MVETDMASANAGRYSFAFFASVVTPATPFGDTVAGNAVLDGEFYEPGSTNTPGAISTCRSRLNESSAGRKKVMVVLTDGNPTLPRSQGGQAAAISFAQGNATLARDDNITVVTIGVQSSISLNLDVLLGLTGSNPELALSVTSFDELKTLLDSLLNGILCVSGGQ